jgi:hypothetical protein
MIRNTVVEDLNKLGSLFHAIGTHQDAVNTPFSKALMEELTNAVSTEIQHNGWFSEASVRSALLGLGRWLTSEKLTIFTQGYPFYHFQKNLSLILAGNLPLVGFHDVMCGLLMGCKLQIKMSSDDRRLLPIIQKALCELRPEYQEITLLNPAKLQGHDAVIGTGTDTSLIHFSSFFKEVPHLLRGNRTSLAVLDGTESEANLYALGQDIFQYFGRGCRSVTHLLIPEDYSLDAFFQAILPFQEIQQNKKYGNNYEYHRAVFMLSQQSLLDNGFILLHENDSLHAPLAMVNYHRHSDKAAIVQYIDLHRDRIQCVIGKDFLPFGSAQQPEIDDFADNINTLAWLSKVLN